VDSARSSPVKPLSNAAVDVGAIRCVMYSTVGGGVRSQRYEAGELELCSKGLKSPPSASLGTSGKT